MIPIPLPSPFASPYAVRPRFSLHRLALIIALLGVGSIYAQRPVFPGGGLGGATGGAAQSGEHVRVTLLADTDAIEPGRPFRIGALFTMEPHWHIYWDSPGDVGLPTELKWAPIHGFKIGPTAYPNPARFEADDLISYGYEAEVMLISTVEPPANLAPGSTVPLAASITWLVCRTDGECIPGELEARLDIKTGPARPSSSTPIFDRWAARLPVDASSASPAIAISQVPADSAIKSGVRLSQSFEVRPSAPWRVRLRSGADQAALFPVAGEAWTLLHASQPRGIGGAHAEHADAFEGLAFPWDVEASGRATPGRIPRVAVLTLPLINPSTGEEKTLLVRHAREIEIAAGTGNPTEPPPAAATVSASSPAATPAPANPAPASPADPDAPVFSFLKEEPREGSALPLALIFLYAFLGGLILNIMPCVLPVVSIKILSFIRQAGEDRRRILVLGLAFAGGVVASFLALATLVVVLRGAGAQLGWGFQFQEPRFIILMTAVIFAFGLSLFGVFSIDLPGTALQQAEGLQRREGPVGAFFNGALATALATPCTAPLLGSALGFAFSQPAYMIYLIFTTISLGMASPYLLLAAFPHWRRFIPKPGNWMEVFKQSMGFMLMGTAVWLLWILGRQTGADGVIATLAFLTAVGVACWLAGMAFDLRATATRRRGLSAVAITIIAAAYLYFPESHLRLFTGQAGSAKSTTTATTTGTPTTAGADAAKTGGIEWMNFSTPLVEELAAANKTIFLDFTADWCLTCKVNEAGVLSRADVAEAFSRNGVVAVRGDYTRQPREMTRILRAFGRAGVPMYVVFPAGRPGMPILLPEVLTPSMVIEAIQPATR